MLPAKPSSSARVGSAETNNPLTSDALRRAGFSTEMRVDQPTRSVPAAHSATSRRIVEGERSRDAELARLLADNLPQHAIVALDAAGDVVDWNIGAEKLLGYTALQIVGRSHSALFAATDDRTSRTPTADLVADGGETEAVFVRRDGSTFPVRLIYTPLRYDRSFGDVVLIVHDITERTRIDELLRARFVETAHLARLGTIGQMVAELAHEINQPLAAAANYARACVNFGKAGRCAIAPEALEWMERSAAQAMRAIEISKRLGNFVKKADGERALVQVNTLVEQAAVLIRSMLKGGADTTPQITLETDFTNSAAEIVADPVQIEQVLLNLMRNAVDAMQDLKHRRHTLMLRTTVDESFVTVSVGDTGPGIAADQLAGLFDPFFTTKASGLGLGLSISRTIVEQHGGRMTVESSPSGTVFSFTLPLPSGGLLPC